MRQFVDTTAKLFFTRIVIEDHEEKIQELQSLFKNALSNDAEIHVNPTAEKRIAVLVTKEYHCLGDILMRHHFNTLNAKITCVIGNYPDLEDLCKRFGIAFHYISHEAKDKEQFESEITNCIDMYKPDYIVLAKFMRILSPSFVAHYTNKLVNIHHSFLPAFIGANPYKKAFDRGVKMIGATAHFVTNDLDEGPIIVQQIIPVNHTFTTETMRNAGKEIETSVLAHAMKLVFEDRVFVYDNKTVVFE